MIENTNKQIEAEQKEQTLLESNLKRSDIYIHFHQAAKNQTNITAAEWNDLQAMIDQTYGMFTKRLYALFPQISEQELRICLLLKISISATGIANLTLRSKQAVTSPQETLREDAWATRRSREMGSIHTSILSPRLYHKLLHKIRTVLKPYKDSKLVHPYQHIFAA